MLNERSPFTTIIHKKVKTNKKTKSHNRRIGGELGKVAAEAGKHQQKTGPRRIKTPEKSLTSRENLIQSIKVAGKVADELKKLVYGPVKSGDKPENLTDEQGNVLSS